MHVNAQTYMKTQPLKLCWKLNTVSAQRQMQQFKLFLTRILQTSNAKLLQKDCFAEAETRD